MAKLAFSKLGLKVNNEITNIHFNDQVIEVKQYISVNDKLKLITILQKHSSGKIPYETKYQIEDTNEVIILKKEELDEQQIIEEIKKLCQTHLAEYSLPFDYEIMDKFPTTSIGKINTTALKEETEKKLHIKQRKKVK